MCVSHLGQTMLDYLELLNRAKKEFEENYELNLVRSNVIKKRDSKDPCKHIEKLYLFHRVYINNLVNKFVNKNPECLEFKNDFYNEGYLLFLRALRTFKLDKEFTRNGKKGRVSFKTHLHSWVSKPLLKTKRDYLHPIDVPQSIVQENKKILDIKEHWGIDSTVLSSDELEVVSLDLNKSVEHVATMHNTFFPILTLAETTEKHIESIPQAKKRDPNVLLKTLMKLMKITKESTNLTEFNIAMIVGKELYKYGGGIEDGMPRSRTPDEDLIAKEVGNRIKNKFEEKGISQESWDLFLEKHFSS